MDITPQVCQFFKLIWDDPHIGPSHISLYLGILMLRRNQEMDLPIILCRSELMRIAKITSPGTYYRCLQELQRLGYIQYWPSFNGKKRSLVYLIS